MAFDFAAVATPFRMHPGLRRLGAGATHFTANTLFDGALREKLEVLSEHADDALLSIPGFAAEAALHAWAHRAAAEHPGALQQHDSGCWHARQLGWSLQANGSAVGDGPPEIGECLNGLDRPWRLAGLLSLAFAEDCAVLDGTTLSVPWLAVCLPSNWSPADKVGRSFAELHEPVADNHSLIGAARQLVGLVTGGQRWERFVWTLTDDPRRARHPRRARPVGASATSWSGSLDPAGLAAVTFLRTERQTFMPLPGTQALFTIHVELRPLLEAAARPADALRLHAALHSMSPAVLAYRGLTAVQGRLLAWLDSAAKPAL